MLENQRLLLGKSLNCPLQRCKGTWCLLITFKSIQKTKNQKKKNKKKQKKQNKTNKKKNHQKKNHKKSFELRNDLIPLRGT